MMKTFSPHLVALTAFFTSFLTASTSAQISHGGEPASLRSAFENRAAVVNVPAPDVSGYMAEDEARGHMPLRYGALIDVALTIADGEWTELADGAWLELDR